jgi:flagellar hook-length control protein FliK
VTTTAPDPQVRTEPTHRVQPALVEAARGLRHEGGGRTSLVVRLDPPELGAVLVRLTVQDGRVDVQLRTPDLAARSDLQAQSWDVQQVLRDSGLDLRSFDVSHGDVLSGELFQGGRDQAGTPDRGTPRGTQGSDGGPGTTHVTDDVADPQPSGTWL